MNVKLSSEHRHYFFKNLKNLQLLDNVLFSGVLNQPYWEFEEAQNHNIDWYVDPCWEAVFRHDASGKALFGSKDSLTEGLESGKRVKLRVGDKFYEASEVILTPTCCLKLFYRCDLQ